MQQEQQVLLRAIGNILRFNEEDIKSIQLGRGKTRGWLSLKDNLACFDLPSLL